MNTRMKKLIFILAATAAGRASAEWPYNPDGGKFTNDPLSVYGRMWTTTVARVAAASNACDMVFIGGSQNQYWYDDDKAFKPIWSNYYGARRAVNLGIAGDNTAQILWRLDNYDFSHIQPKAVVMLIGFNDRNDTSNRIAAGVTQVLGRVRSYLPAAKVLLVSLTPCIDTNMAAKMLAVNTITATEADQTNVFFVNTFAKFTPIPGATNEWLGVDPADDLHYLSSGYELWAQEMESLVAGIVGGSPAAQTPAQWRSSVEALPDLAADSDLEDLQEGCRIEVTTRNSLKLTGNTSLNNFRAWTNSTGSYTNALYTNVLHRWLNNLSLNAAESNHLPMVKAAYLRQAWDSAGALQRTGSSEAWDIYATKVRTNGEALMTNAFMGASLSAANIEALREYCIYIQMQLTNAERIPSQFGITRTKATPFEIGENAPDFMLRKAETVFDSPTFTNAVLQDMKMFLKPKGVLEVLRLFTGYTSTGGVCVVKPFPASVSNETDYVRRQTNNTKPVVLMMGKTSDVFLRRNIPVMDTLYQAYRDVADIYIVHISYHDSYSTAPYYYGPYAGGSAEKVPWQWTEEDFAQDVRRSMIRYPSVSIPFLVDDESHRNRNSIFTDGGDSHFVIIDRTGKIAYAAPRLSSEGQNPFDAILQANDVEVELRKVLANDGLAEAGRDRDIPNVPRQALIDAGGISNYRPTATVPLWLTGRITAIDTVSNTVTILRPAVNTNILWGYNIIQENNPAVTLGASYTEAPKNLALLDQWVADGEKEYTLAVGAGYTNFSFSTTVNTNVTEIYLNGLPVQIGSLAVGDFIGAMYNNTTDESSSVIKPLYFRSSRLAVLSTSTSTLTIPEGQTNSFQIRLSAMPSSVVTVTVAWVSGDTDIAVVTPMPLQFDSSSWSNWQTVAVTAQEDADFSNGMAVLSCAMPDSGAINVTVTETDNDQDPLFALPFSETFETSPTNMAGAAGSLNGQHGWTATGTNAAVQSAVAHGGSQALRLQNVSAIHVFNGAPTNVTVSFYTQPQPQDAPASIPAGSEVVFWMSKTNGAIVAYSNGTLVAAGVSAVSNDWNFFEIVCDYVSKHWTLAVNGTNAPNSFGFHTGTAGGFSELRVQEQSVTGFSYIDDINVTGPDLGSDADADGLPDSWEEFYYGSNAPNPGDLCANGVNTVLEAYIAGFDPTGANASFGISNVRNVLWWNGATGRVYTIYWTSNLLSGFQTLETNVNWPRNSWTDTVHGAENQGFYQIKVQLSPY